MIVRAPHLQDDVLYECYYAERRGESIDPPSAEHLADCEACARRFADVGGFLTTLSADAEAEVDARFPPERLRQQQHEIAKRLELVGRAARVITFPGRRNVALPQTVRSSTTRIATRWIAAAAAAGLFVGVAAGTFFNFVPGFDFASNAGRNAVVAAARQTSSPSHLSSSPIQPAADIVDTDDRFMSDLESVLDRPHTSELVAFDALTPHVREIRDFAR
jgi:anti-sigma factor RsiW